MQSPLMAEPPQVAAHGGVPAPLGFVAGGIRWLVESGQGVQVIDAVITPVPLAQPWYLGLVRHRQKLLGAVDLAGLCGLAVLPLKTPERMLVLPGPWHAALRVDRVQGLVDALPLPLARETDAAPSMQVQEASVLAHHSEERVDGAGTRWRVLDVARLCTSAAFLHAGISLST
jgi:twitching motility protein PilI